MQKKKASQLQKLGQACQKVIKTLYGMVKVIIQTKTPIGMVLIRSLIGWKRKTYKMHVRVFLSKYRGYFNCPDCNGDRLKKESVCWKWNSLSLPELYDLSIDDLLGQLEAVKLLDIPKIDIAVQNIKARLKYLQDVGLGYLSLNRSAKTLSGGETQRVNLTACLGASLTETLFALDEPTIGLHGRDIKKLITVLRALADAGNCVCVVEHDEEIIKSADKIFEVGPRPGVNGGRITFTGSVAQIKKSKSITGKWLSRCQIKDFFKNTKSNSEKSKLQLKIKSASKHNINNLSCSFPIEGLTCIAGISGSKINIGIQYYLQWSTKSNRRFGKFCNFRKRI